jgi:hypothetical protein
MHRDAVSWCNVSLTGNLFAAISHVRDQAWTTIKKRRHEIERVYAFDAEGLDLMLIGSVTMGFG